MKSRIKKAPKIILSFNLSNEQEDILNSICNKNNISQKNVLPQQAYEQIGFLFNFNGFVSKEQICENPPKDECLVFSGIEHSQLNQLLKDFRNEGLVINYKAICTPSNQSWSLKDLITELTAEHNKLNGDKK